MRSFSFNSLAIIYAVSMLLTSHLLRLPHLPIIPFGGFIITSVIFLIIHYIHVQNRYAIEIKKDFVTNYFIGFGLLMLAFTYLVIFSIVWQLIFDVDEISIVNIISSIFTYMPGLIGYLFLALIKTLVLALLTPLIFYGKTE